jgi:Glycosyl transferases group 1
VQQCRIVLNLKGAGCDTFRFWENAACNAVHVSQNMPLLMPNDFINGRHLLRFSDIEELFQAIDRILEGAVDERHMIEASREHLRLHHTTVKRTIYLLDRLGQIFFLSRINHIHLPSGILRFSTSC